MEGLGKALACLHLFLITLLVFGVVLVGDFLTQDDFLESHICRF